jgi:hypothetical protein
MFRSRSTFLFPSTHALASLARRNRRIAQLSRRLPTITSLTTFTCDFRPLAVEFLSLAKSAEQYPSFALSHPLSSYSYPLFCKLQNANILIFSKFRTLCAKRPGGGMPLAPSGLNRIPSPFSSRHSPLATPSSIAVDYALPPSSASVHCGATSHD